ncbi:hypothetical protein J6W34_05855, partial [bacterium]|nr:hypothetical protein [bacterium]
IKELKNTKVDINNLVLRDYDNKNHEHEIIATDVTYLPGTFDANKIIFIFQQQSVTKLKKY